MFARVSRVDFLPADRGPGDPGSSVLVEFDAVDVGGSRVFDSFRPDETDPFALLRVLADRRDFGTGSRSLPRVGEWFGLTVAPVDAHSPRAGSLYVYHAQLGPDGYETAELGELTSLTAMPVHRRRDRREVGGLPALVVDGATHQMPSSLLRACMAPRELARRSRVAAILSDVPPPASVVVRDVGQASFSSLCDANGRAVLHYDVGLPVSFNREKNPPELDLEEHGRPPVILSHWDWDHLCAALRHKHLLDLPWIVPAQRLGPGAARVSKILRRRGGLHVRPKGPSTSFAFGCLSRARGDKRSLNETGLTLEVSLRSGRTAMLTGDAEYSHLGQRGGSVDHLVATHHGARFKSGAEWIPRSKGSHGLLALSFAAGNDYGHPHETSLEKHRVAGWTSEVSTAESPTRGRGDIVLE